MKNNIIEKIPTSYLLGVLTGVVLCQLLVRIFMY